MAEKNKKPEIRITEFTDAWEQRKVGDMIDGLYNGQTPSRFRDDFWNGNINWLSSGELNRSIIRTTSEKITVAGQDNANLRIVPKNTFVMAITGLEAAGTRGNCGILDIDTTINQSCMAVFPNKKLLSTQFLFQWYMMVGEDYGIRFTQGTKQQSYNAEIIKNLDICLPKVEEQLKIGGLLSEFDNLITLYQRKYDKLVIVKKSMLEKMFPKGEAKVPEIRFAGFTCAWEQRKLNEFIETSKEKNRDDLYTKDDVLSVSGDVGIVNQIAFQGRSFAGASVTNYGVVDTGDIVYTKSPLKINPYGIIKTNKGKPGIVSTLYAVYKPKENTNPHFVQCYFESDYRLNKYLKPLVNKGAKNDMKVSDDNALTGLVIFPSYDEQTRIAEFLECLDNLIIFHQRELEKLKNIKKSMLEKMFV